MISTEVMLLLKNSIENEFNTVVDIYDKNGSLINEYAYASEAHASNCIDPKDENLIPVSDKEDVYGYLRCKTYINPQKREAIKLFIRAVVNLGEKALVIDKIARTETLLVTRMLSEDAHIYYNDIVAYGADLGYRLNHPMAVIVTSLESNHPTHFNINYEFESATNDAKHHILRLIKEHPYMGKQDIVALTHDNCLVVIKMFFEMSDIISQYKTIDKLSSMISNILSSYRIFRYYIAPGEIIETFSDAHIVYQDALNSLSYAKKMDLENPIIKHDDIMYNTIISKLPRRIKIEIIDAKVKFLLSQNHEMLSGLIGCFDAFINNSFNIAETAYEAYLHRNTVKKRLTKLYNLTGFDPMGDFEDVIMNKMILHEYLIKSKGQEL